MFEGLFFTLLYMNGLDRNEQFKMAAAFINQTARSIFLTGKAGTGKTTFLRYICDNCYKNMIILAPTGVAAINAGGVTIHSFFQLPFGTYSPNANSGWGNQDGDVYNKTQLLSKLRFNRSKLDLIRELDLIIIDEVSMVRADLMDAIDEVLRTVRRAPELPFGGIQMLFIGDLLQLPPVVKDTERVILNELYPTPFFFSAHVLQESQPIYIELEKIYRQSDEQFIGLLNKIRNNQCNFDDLSFLNSFYKPLFEPDSEEEYITLCSHNYIADRINEDALNALPSRLLEYDALVKEDFPEKSYPVAKTLYLKEGAQIMFIKNDKGEKRRYYNGKIGTIASLTRDSIKIKFKGENELMELPLEKWSNIRYKYDEIEDKIEEEELGTFEQFPIRLAWAITIHKSQGLTFEKAIIDAGKAFAPGQVYVALSRMTGLDGLVLRSRIHDSSISVDNQVSNYLNLQSTPEGDLKTVLEVAQQEYMGEWAQRIFDWFKLREKTRDFLSFFDGKTVESREELLGKFRPIVFAVEAQFEVASKFSRFLQYHLPKGKNDQYKNVFDKTQSAGVWFETALTKEAIKPLHELLDIVKAKKRSTKFQKEMKQLIFFFEKKLRQVQQAVLLIKGLHEQQSVLTILDEINTKIPEPDKVIATKRAKGDSMAITLGMYNEGKSIPEIATERGLATGTIESHLIKYIPTGEVDISVFADQDTCKRISAFLDHHAETTLTEIKNAFEDAFSFGQIRAVYEWYKAQKVNS